MKRHPMIAMCACGVSAPAAAAQVLGRDTSVFIDPASGGRITVVSTVYELPGREARYDYRVRNDSFDPVPPVSNGFSGLHVEWGLLPGPLAHTGYAPPGWHVELRVLPGYYFGATFTDPTGPGLPIGTEGDFGFTSGRAFNSIPFFPLDTAFSHGGGVPTHEFILIDSSTGHGPLAPVPAPGAWITASALAGVGLRRRRAPSLNAPRAQQIYRSA